MTNFLKEIDHILTHELSLSVRENKINLLLNEFRKND